MHYYVYGYYILHNKKDERLWLLIFRALQNEGLLLDDHIGGCTLYMNKDKVEAIMNAENN